MFPPASPLIVLQEIDSTNEEAKRRLLDIDPAVPPFILHALAQTHGKGTQGRKWASPPGHGLYFSLVIPGGVLQQHPGAALTEAVWTLAAGAACAEALFDLTGLSVRLKPVNDLYLNGCKLGGILVESVYTGQICRGLITGIGVNLRPHEDIDALCRTDGRHNKPISLEEALQKPLAPGGHQWAALMQDCILTIGERVGRYYETLLAGGQDDILARYQALALSDLGQSG